MPEIKLEKADAEQLWNKARESGLKVKFSSYYKYSFAFAGETEDCRIALHFGMNSDDVYRYDVNADKKIELPETLDGFKEEYHMVFIQRKSDGAIYTAADY